MPFNGSGTFSIVNTFIPNTTILSAAVNQNFTDIATGLSDCLTRDGQAGMTAALSIVSGTAAAPGLRFNAEVTGMYLAATNQIGWSIAGVNAFTMSAPSATAGGGIIGKSGSILTPIGGLMDFAGTTAPTGWLLCDGSAISRTTYVELFTVIGTTWGIGDNVTTFNIPDLRGRAVYGRDDMGGSAANRITNAVSGLVGTTVGATGGNQAATIAQANLPAATLTTTITDPTHTHSVPSGGGTQAAPISAGGNVAQAGVAQTTGATSTGITASTALGGSGTGLPVLNPAAIVNKIIFAGHP